MRTLKFKVNAQVIERVGDFSNLVTGTSGYLEASFSFSEEWSGCNKVASFWAGSKEYPVSIKNNKCIIPEEVLTERYFSVQVTGKNKEYKIRTGKVRVTQKEG